MTMRIRSQKSLTADLLSRVQPASADAHLTRGRAQRSAIFAVHGISPIQRYAFQDQVASAFQSYLNAQEQAAKLTFTWKAIVHWPKLEKEDANRSDSVHPSALRIYRSDDDPDEPTGRIYDVYEGYWSPFSKGKTNIVSALQWLLNATFLGSSSTANIPCTPAKLRSDLTYVAALLGLALIGCGLAVVLGLVAWLLLAQMLPSGGHVSYWAFLQDPLHMALTLPLVVYLEFAIDIVIGYVLAQIFVVHMVGRDRAARTATLSQDSSVGGTFEHKTISARAFHGSILWILWLALAVLIALAVGLAVFPGNFHMQSPLLLAVYTLLVVLSVGSLQGARWLADFAVEDVLGDVQIYTTHDNNSTFFTIRQQIIAAVGGALRGVLSAVVDPTTDEPEPYYDAIHVLAHSLGSTIGMDALILLRQMIQQGTVAEKQWDNIRSLTTFGSALEKTRFFFDVRQPNLNAAQDQWENDVYGRFFTDTRPAPGGIYWANYWYFRDIVANAIVSYASDVAVGASFRWSREGSAARTICLDVPLLHDRPRWAWVHSDYLADALFWAAVGPVLAN